MVNSQKEQVVKNISKIISAYNAFAVVSHKSLSFKQLQKVKLLIGEKKETHVEKFKNTLMNISLKNSKFKAIKNLKKENLFIFSNNVFELSKVCVNLVKIKTNGLVSAQFENFALNLDEMKFLSKINTKEELISSIFSSIINSKVINEESAGDAVASEKGEEKND